MPRNIRPTSPRPTPTAWAIYTRVSTEEQAQQGISLEAQVKRCQGMLQGQGLSVAEVYEDAGFSAKDLRRPALQRLLADARDGKVAGIMVWKLDRLTRNTRDLLRLEEDLKNLRVGLASVQERLDTGTAGGRFSLTLMGALSQLEREQTGERVRAVIVHKKAKGEFCGGQIPAGMRATGPNGHRTLEVDPTWGPVVAKVWERVANGDTLLGVARFLTESGMPTPRKGSRWAKNNVSRLLAKRLYVGVLVDEATFERCRTVIDQRYAPTFGRTATNRSTCHPNTLRVWMLQGIARCAHCGSALVGSCHGANRLPYLRCSGRAKRGKGFCRGRNIPARPYEKLVMEALVAEIGKGTELAEAISIHLARMKAQAAPELKRRGALEIERDHLKSQIDGIFDLLLSKQIPPSEGNLRMTPLVERKEAINLELARLEGLTAAIVSTQFTTEYIMARLREMAGNLLELPEEEQRAIIQGLVREVAIDRAKSLTITLALPGPMKQQYPPFPVGMPVSNGDLDGT